MQPTEQSSTSFTLRQVAPISTPTAELEQSKPVKPLVESEKSEDDVNLFEAKWGRPLLADLYEMSGLGDFAKQELSEVNRYILSEIKERNLTPSKESYKAILANIEDALYLNPNTTYDEKLKKVRSYVELIMRQKNLELRKKLLENVQ